MPGGTGGSEDPEPPLPMLKDFPSEPQFEQGALPSMVEAFAESAGKGAGPCVVSPEVDTLYPKNWLRPRLEVKAKSSHNAFQFIVSSEELAHALVVYSRKPSITLDAGLWSGLRNTVIDQPIRVRVRSAALDTMGHLVDGPSEVSESSFSVAPVAAPGKILYWSLPKDDTGGGLIRGFGIGEEGVVDVLRPEQVAARDNQAKCVGCHAATPDGDAVAFAVGPSGYKASIASVSAVSAGELPAFVNTTTLTRISALFGPPAFSPAHWAAGDRTMLLNDAGELRWVGLEDDASGTLLRMGDSRAASVPSWSHDGETVVYTSAAGITVGRPEHGPMDLRIVPYAAGLGGVSRKLSGAAEPDFNEYYPAYSPDDALVAFTRVPDAQAVYDAPPAEVMVIPAQGGTAHRLRANDPPACLNQTSPGLTNSWPKWSPRAQTVSGRTYYFLTFSSRRRGIPQLYVTALVDDGGRLTSYPALYLWNQPADEGNHTPDWEDIHIASVPVPK